MKKKVLIIVALIFLVSAIVFIVLISGMKKSVTTSQESRQLNLAAKLIETFYRLGEYDKAMDCYTKAMDLAIEIKDFQLQAKIFSNRAMIYFYKGDNQKTIEGFKKALEIGKKIKNNELIAGNYMNLATVYNNLSMNDSAIVYYKKALETYKQTDYTYGISNLYINLGDVYKQKKDYVESEKLLIKALQSKTALNEFEGIAIVNNHLANLFLSKSDGQKSSSVINQLNKAESFGLASYKIAKRLGTLPVMREASKVLKKIYQQQEKFHEALKYSEIFNTLSDSLLNKGKIQALTFAEARWNVEKKQQEINNLEKTQQLNKEIIQRKEAETKQQKIINWFETAIILLMAFLIIFLIYYHRRKRDLLYHQQLKNLTELKMLNVRNRMSPHFTFNVLESIYSIVHEPEIAKNKIRSLSTLLRRIVESVETTSITLATELDIVEAYIDLKRNKIPLPFKFEINIADDIDTQMLMPAMIVQIQVENALKHGLIALEDGPCELIITVDKKGNDNRISIRDNGIGFKTKTRTTAGTGTGLKMVMQTIQFLNLKNKHKIRFSITDIREIEESSRGTIAEILLPTDFNYNL